MKTDRLLNEYCSRSPTLNACPFVDQPLANISVDLGGTTEMTCHFGNLSTPANVEWFGPDDSLVTPCDTLSVVPLDEKGYSKLQVIISLATYFQYYII